MLVILASCITKSCLHLSVAKIVKLYVDKLTGQFVVNLGGFENLALLYQLSIRI